MACAEPVYRPRDAEHTVLHQVVSEHLDAFLRAAVEAGDGVGLPQFVEREVREFLTCGVFEGGVARFRCEDCAREHLVPFSCKGRGFCPSCGGRRMTERAAHLVDAVLPWVPVRQWVLTVPFRLRYRLAWDHGLSRAVLGVYARVLLDMYARGARARGIDGGRTGLVTVMQRCSLTTGVEGQGPLAQRSVEARGDLDAVPGRTPEAGRGEGSRQTGRRSGHAGSRLNRDVGRAGPT